MTCSGDLSKGVNKRLHWLRGRVTGPSKVSEMCLDSHDVITRVNRRLTFKRFITEVRISITFQCRPLLNQKRCSKIGERKLKKKKNRGVGDKFERETRPCVPGPDRRDDIRAKSCAHMSFL